MSHANGDNHLRMGERCARLSLITTIRPWGFPIDDVIARLFGKALA